MAKAKKNIGVIGLGLIGGSILKSLDPSSYNLIGITRSSETISKALSEKIINHGFLLTELEQNRELLKSLDYVFICSPIGKTVKCIKQIASFLSKETIITDVAGIKNSIVEEINAIADFKPRFVGGHPMAGTEYSGLSASFKGLFKEAKWVLVKSKYSDSSDIESLADLIKSMDAVPIFSDSDTHDKAVAFISHFPLFLSQSLYSMVSEHQSYELVDLAFSLAASGFRDTTRLVKTNPQLSVDMLLGNKQNVKYSLNLLIDQLKNIEKKLDCEIEYSRWAKKIAQKRTSLYSDEGKNVYNKDSKFNS